MMWSRYGCVYNIVTVILYSYGVNSQNYYHTLEPTRDGYDYITNTAKPEPFTLYGNPIPQKNGNYENIQIPSVFYKYPVTYKATQEVPAKVVTSSRFDENKDANVQVINIPTNNKNKNNDLKPKVEAYLITNDSKNDDDKHIILDPEENIESDNNDASQTKKEETNHKNRDEENIEIDNKIVAPAWNETIVDKIDFDDNNNGITKLKDTLGILSNKSYGEVKLIGEPFIKIMNVNIGQDNLLKNARDEVSRPLLEDLDTKEKKDQVKRIIITLPDSDTTTVIISSKKDNETSENTKEEHQNKRNTHLRHSSHGQKYRNMGPNLTTNNYKQLQTNRYQYI
ncbi:uncharacterized protein LOC121738100 [Aricia agestis]|uniref:uncharacterized protein LOC121738100 n=1 Tax=Aricia agestis TaxID=91739 RepID=UPI001C2026CE|nr:uncharacterized protein LOC121738100 [Aricia agestis]